MNERSCVVEFSTYGLDCSTRIAMNTCNDRKVEFSQRKLGKFEFAAFLSICWYTHSIQPIFSSFFDKGLKQSYRRLYFAQHSLHICAFPHFLSYLSIGMSLLLFRVICVCLYVVWVFFQFYGRIDEKLTHFSILMATSTTTLNASSVKPEPASS